MAYLDERDARREAKLERQPWPGSFDTLEGLPLASEFEAKRLEGGVGYVRFTLFIPSLDQKLRAVVAGKRSAGNDLDASFKKLPTGAYLLYAYGEPRTPKGVVIEDCGVEPDIEVELTRAGLLQGRDAQLEAALKYVREHAKPPQSE